MKIKSNIFAFTAATLLICACGSDKNASSTPPPEETIQSMSQLRASSMGACPTIAGRYKCIENCDGEGASTEPAVLLLKQKGNGPQYHYALAEEQPSSFTDYLLSKYMFDDGGLNVDGQVYDKSAPIKNALETINRQLDGLAGRALRKTLSLFGIDVAQEMMKIDIPNVTAGYQASCNDKVLSLHYVIDKSAFKFKMKNLSETTLEVKFFSLEDQKLQTQTYKVELVEAVAGGSATALKDQQAAGTSLFTSWRETNPYSIRLENAGIYSYRNGSYLNMVFRKVGSDIGTSLYGATSGAYWGEEGYEYAYVIDVPNLYLDLSNLKVFTRDSRGVDKEVGSIYEKDGRAYIHLALDCGGLIFKTCELE